MKEVKTKIEKLKEEISSIEDNGYKEIFLYTELDGYYEKSGWIPFDKGYEYTGSEVCIYRQSI